jgi:fumarylacetoacetate (FAA) hydrolase
VKLASLARGGRDGTLVVVDRALERAVVADGIAPTMQAALDRWSECAPRLHELAASLEGGRAPGASSLDLRSLAAPFPRAVQFADGSAYLNHVELVRRARGAEMPESFRTEPLMYQAVSDGFLAAHEPIPLEDESFGCDYEAEIGVVVDDVPIAASAAETASRIVLVLLINDVSLRNLIPAELAKGFGFFHGKPQSGLSPVAVTPDELGAAWDGARLHRPLRSWVNGVLTGEPDAGADMQFGFPELLAHAARTRPLAAGTIVGSGTVSNVDRACGVSCLAERRMIETIDHGAPRTPFLRHGDRVRIEMTDDAGRTIFGAIEQTVVPLARR